MASPAQAPQGTRSPRGHIVAALIVAVAMALLALYVGVTRYYNAQELSSLVESAEAQGRSYTVILHNWLTGSYTFTAE